MRARPHGTQGHAHRGQDRHVKNRQKILRKILGLVEFQSDATKSQIQHAGAARSCFADHGIGIGAGHGDTFRFPLNRVENRMGCLSGSLVRDGLSGSGRRHTKFRGEFFRQAAGRWKLAREKQEAGSQWRLNGRCASLRELAL